MGRGEEEGEGEREGEGDADRQRDCMKDDLPSSGVVMILYNSIRDAYAQLSQGQTLHPCYGAVRLQHAQTPCVPTHALESTLG